MAEVQLSRADAQGGCLPRICMQCGEPATEDVLKKYSSDRVALMAPPDEPIGCLLVWPFVALLKVISMSAAKTMSVRTPLCQKHARGWWTWWNIDAKSITDDAIVLTGVSERFAEACQQRPPSPAREPVAIKVRCQNCQSLNEETAKFCNQCGKSI